MTFIITVSNVKGGVGKTSTAIALGSSLAKIGQRVLLVDFDAQADLTSGVGISPETTLYTSKNLFIPRFLDSFPIDRLIKKTRYPNLDLIPSDGEITWNEHQMPDFKNDECNLKNIFGKINPPYDFAVIDCPPAASIYIRNAMNAANLLIIPTQAEYFSANSLIKMISLVEQMRQQSNPTLEYRILVTLFDARSRIQNQILEKFQQGFKDNLFSTFIGMDTKIRESQAAHTPITEFIPESRSSLRYQALAHEILALVPLLVQKQQIRAKARPTIKSIVTRTATVNCPFLGLRNDPSTGLDFPSEQNHCHRANPPEVPRIEHQDAYCLEGAYITCPMISMADGKPLPDSLRKRSPGFWSKFEAAAARGFAGK